MKQEVTLMNGKNYALVVGGTGMLAQMSCALVNDYYYVSVVRRSTIRHQQLKESCEDPDNLHTIEVDYHDDEQFRHELQKAFQKYGAPDLIVSWIHGSAPHALKSLIDERVKVHNTRFWKLVHVQSSSRFFEKENTPVPEKCQYRRVYLGFISDGTSSRWLTHAEISNGVFQAIQTDELETIVGTLEPWDKRP